MNDWFNQSIFTGMEDGGYGGKIAPSLENEMPSDRVGFGWKVSNKVNILNPPFLHYPTFQSKKRRESRLRIL